MFIHVYDFIIISDMRIMKAIGKTILDNAVLIQESGEFKFDKRDGRYKWFDETSIHNDE